MENLEVGDSVEVIQGYERYGNIVDMTDFLYFILFHDSGEVEAILKTKVYLMD